MLQWYFIPFQKKKKFKISNNSTDGGDKYLYDNHGGSSSSNYRGGTVTDILLCHFFFQYNIDDLDWSPVYFFLHNFFIFLKKYRNNMVFTLLPSECTPFFHFCIRSACPFNYLIILIKICPKALYILFKKIKNTLSNRSLTMTLRK